MFTCFYCRTKKETHLNFNFELFYCCQFFFLFKLSLQIVKLRWESNAKMNRKKCHNNEIAMFTQWFQLIDMNLIEVQWEFHQIYSTVVFIYISKPCHCMYIFSEASRCKEQFHNGVEHVYIWFTKNHVCI